MVYAVCRESVLYGQYLGRNAPGKEGRDVRLLATDTVLSHSITEYHQYPDFPPGFKGRKKNILPLFTNL